MKVSACKQGFKYMVVNKDWLIEKKSQAGFLYADDVCLMASNEQNLQMIFDNISGCINIYGMKVSEKNQRWCVYMDRRKRYWGGRRIQLPGSNSEGFLEYGG